MCWSLHGLRLAFRLQDFCAADGILYATALTCGGPRSVPRSLDLPGRIIWSWEDPLRNTENELLTFVTTTAVRGRLD